MFPWPGNQTAELSLSPTEDGCLSMPSVQLVHEVSGYVALTNTCTCIVKLSGFPAISPALFLLPHRDAWQIYSSAAYGRMTNWTFVNPMCNEQTEGFVLSEVSFLKKKSTAGTPWYQVVTGRGLAPNFAHYIGGTPPGDVVDPFPKDRRGADV